MSTLAVEQRPQARGVKFTDTALIVDLTDGRTISAPLSWMPKLLVASNEQRKSWELLGEGSGIHWPDIDEDLSVAGLLAGRH